MKKTLLFIVVIFAICLSSCSQDTTQIAKNEFSKYYNGKNEVVLNLEDNLYFEDHTLLRDNLSPKNLSGTIVFYEGFIYYLSLESSSMGFQNDSINVYSCDLYGENTKMVHSQQLNIQSKVEVKVNNDSYYIQYVKDDLTFIDKYTISTNVYESIAKGKDCSLSSYIQEETSRYKIEMIENSSPTEHGKFIVTDLEAENKKVIDDEYLKSTPYAKSMEKFNYAPKRYDIENGCILLTYSIAAGDGWNFAHLVFVYNFDSDTMDYKLLAFPYDNLPVDLIYVD